MKTYYKFVILGSGIGGLSVAAELKSRGEEDFIVIDKTPNLPANLHNGLHTLYHTDFKTPFPFQYKEVVMTQEIWNVEKNEFSKSATLPQMFEYSKKIMENLRHPSSIMNPDAVSKTYVPESGNMNDLLEAYYSYIGEEHFVWNAWIFSIDLPRKSICFENKLDGKNHVLKFGKCISTIPAPNLYKYSGESNNYTFKNKTIYIANYETTNIVPNWLIVLYISNQKFKPYRMTVMNNILSMESIEKMNEDDKVIVKYHTEEFFDYELSSEKTYEWETGRIFGLDREQREQMVNFWKEKNIHLLGRFARWDGKLMMTSTIEQAQRIVTSIVENKPNWDFI